MAIPFISFCKEKPKNPVAEYGDAMMNAYQKGQEAGKTGNLYAVKQAVQAYHAAHGTYPRNLDELEDLIGSKIDASLFDYDPQTGRVALKGS
jgi:hypothetical protein